MVFIIKNKDNTNKNGIILAISLLALEVTIFNINYKPTIEDNF